MTNAQSEWDTYLKDMVASGNQDLKDFFAKHFDKPLFYDNPTSLDVRLKRLLTKICQIIIEQKITVYGSMVYDSFYYCMKHNEDVNMRISLHKSLDTVFQLRYSHFKFGITVDSRFFDPNGNISAVSTTETIDGLAEQTVWFIKNYDRDRERMTWTAVTSDDMDFCQKFVYEYPLEEIIKSDEMYDFFKLSFTEREEWLAGIIIKWITVARKEGYGGPTFTPSLADFAKSALFERLRSGKEPLAEPPPVFLSCPYYGIVEDEGPHMVGLGLRDNQHNAHVDGDHIDLGWSLGWTITETKGENRYIVKDRYKNTSYRFHLWWDSNYTPPSTLHEPPRGGWFMQNVIFTK